MLAYIDNLNDDNGLMNPGTNAWDLRGNAATVPTHTFMTDREYDEQFNAYDRTPVELMVSNANFKAPQKSAVPMDELLASADQYTDIAQAGRYELNMASIAEGKRLPLNTLSAKQMGRLIDLIQAGDGMDDVDEQPSANSESFEAWLGDSEETNSVRSEIAKEVPVDSPKSGQELRLSDLGTNNDSSWIGFGVSGLRTPTLPRGIQQIQSPDGRVRTIGVV
jgi:hypothetical protein